MLADLAGALEPEIPDVAVRINRLLGNEVLRDMCTEYEECSKCLGRWARSPSEHKDRIAEYTELLADLRQEILQYLWEHSP